MIYTSVLNKFVLSYSKTWILPLALIAAALYLALVSSRLKSDQMALGDLVAGAVLFFGALIAALLAVGVLVLFGVCWSLLCDIVGAPATPWLKYDVFIMTAFAVLSVAITVAIARWWANSRPLWGLVLGALFWWLGLSLATATWLPGASYLFVWPTLGGLIGLLISSRFARGSAPAWAAAFVGSIPALLLVAPLIRTTFDGLSLPMAEPVMVLVVLFAGVLMPLWGPLVLRQPEPAIPSEREERAQLELAVEHAS